MARSEDLIRCAVHEAGHAVMAALLGLEVTTAMISRDAPGRGRCSVACDQSEVPPLVTAAGMAAHSSSFGDRGLAIDDEHAIEVAGFDVAELVAEARALLEPRFLAVDHLSVALLERSTLTGSEVREVVVPRLADERVRLLRARGAGRRHTAVADYYRPKLRKAYDALPQRSATTDLAAVLVAIRTDGWVAGVLAAAAGKGGAAITANLGDVDLGAPPTWAPGWAESASLPDDVPATLQGLIEDAASFAANIADSPSDLSADDWAEQTADTVAAGAAQAGAVGAFQAGGYDQWNFVAEADACDECLSMEDGNPYDSGDDGPPVHPRCGCESEPVTDA